MFGFFCPIAHVEQLNVSATTHSAREKRIICWLLSLGIAPRLSLEWTFASNLISGTAPQIPINCGADADKTLRFRKSYAPK